MIRGPLFLDMYKPQFSGHETFPLRHGWLKKAFDEVAARDGDPENRTIFNDDGAIARFGVGKNMVAAIRHWAATIGIISDSSKGSGIVTTRLGRFLFGVGGRDLYLENPASLWLIHWKLAGNPDKTTWFWAFSHFTSDSFEREHLVKGLERLSKDRGWIRGAAATIKRDVECFVRTYVARISADHGGYEDALESPLAELGLVKPIGKRDGFRFVRGMKTSLTPGVFLYALVDFWRSLSNPSTLSFEAIAHEPGSPGRVFLLEESDLVERLQEVEDFSHGAFRWSETAGLKQVIRNHEISEDSLFELLANDYDLKNR